MKAGASKRVPRTTKVRLRAALLACKQLGAPAAVASVWQCASSVRRVNVRAGRDEQPKPKTLTPSRVTAILSQAVEAVDATTSCCLPLVHTVEIKHIFGRLSLDDRVRCLGVSKAWRNRLRSPDARSLWSRLDVSPASGLPRLRSGAMEGLLRVASRVAALNGGVEILDCTGTQLTPYRLLWYVIPELARSNAGSLRELRVSQVGCNFDLEHALDVLRAAPQLRLLEADLMVNPGEEAQLATLGTFAAARVRTLSAYPHYQGMLPPAFVAACLRELRDNSACASLHGLYIGFGGFADVTALRSVVDACISHRIASLSLANGTLCDGADALPLLTRLLQAGHLLELCLADVSDRRMDGPPFQLLNGEPGAVGAFADALRQSRIIDLRMRGVQLWAVPANARTVMAALTGHPTLRSLSISFNELSKKKACIAAAGDTLAALLAADAPALLSLRLKNCDLDWRVLGPLFGALAANSHLRALECAQFLDGVITAAQAQTKVVPAVRACAALRRVGWDGDRCGVPGIEALVDRFLDRRADGYAMLAGLPPA